MEQNYNKAITSDTKLECSECGHKSKTHTVELSDDYDKIILSCEDCETVLNNDYNIPTEYPVSQKTYKLRFGKYKGTKLVDIDDINYLIWLFGVELFPNNKLAIQERLWDLEQDEDEPKQSKPTTSPSDPKKILNQIPIPLQTLANKLGKDDFLTLSRWIVNNVSVEEPDEEETASEWIMNNL